LAGFDASLVATLNLKARDCMEIRWCQRSSLQASALVLA